MELMQIRIYLDTTNYNYTDKELDDLCDSILDNVKNTIEQMKDKYPSLRVDE